MNEPVQMSLDLYTGITEQSEDTPVSDNITPLSIASQITYDFKLTGLTENYPEQK